MQYFADKVIWITGASSGIGKQTAINLSKIRGTKLILSARRLPELQQTQEICNNNGAQCFVVVLDLEQSETLHEKANEALHIFGRIDILINNGGIGQRSSVLETPIENDRKIMEINYFSSVILTKAVLPSMISNKSGHIVAVSSISGCFGFPLRSAYCASKHAMYGFYEALDIELRSKGIKVTIVAPGRIQTDLSYSALTKDGTPHGKMDDGQKYGMPLETCVLQILQGISKAKHEVLIGRKELVMVHIYRKIPRLFHYIISKVKPT